MRKIWYFTDLDFDPHISLQGSNHWDDVTEREKLVGEQWIDPPWPERPRTIDGLTGSHECGELSDFEEGQPWPYDGEPIEYDAQNIPLCCPRTRREEPVTGGMELGGEVGDVFKARDSVTGGMELGGEVGDVVGPLDGLRGGIELGGACLPGGETIDHLHGGVELGGDVGDVAGLVDPLAGGVELGGEVGDVAGLVDPLSGGIEMGGAWGDRFSAADPLSGGVELGGQVGDLAAYADPLAGGVELGGQVGDKLDATLNGSTTCLGAPATVLNVTYHSAAPAALPRFFTWAIPNGVYTITATDTGATHNTYIVFPDAVSCSNGGTFVALANGVPQAITVTNGFVIFEALRVGTGRAFAVILS